MLGGASARGRSSYRAARPSPTPPRLPQAAVPNGDAAAAAHAPDHLLDDFIPVGPAAGAAAAAAAAPEQGRPPLLTGVPWLRSLKGIRSPLMRLHQGGREWLAGGQRGRAAAAARPVARPA